MPDLIPMFRPSGLLRPMPTLPGLAGFEGFGGGRPRMDISPFMPDEAAIAGAQAEQAEEEPWWVKLLRIPDRLLFGQSVKGFLAGTGEGGFLTGIGRAIQNNPLFQILDVLPGVDITRDTSFTDVRKALDLNFGQADVNTGAANFFINLFGEILTDPSSFWMPFAKVGAGARAVGAGGAEAAFLGGVQQAAQAGRRGVQQALPGLTGAGMLAQSPEVLGLMKAVETGQRAMWVFKVPFLDGNFVVQPFKSMDLKVAQGLEKWADFLNTNPVTKPILQAFSRTAVGIGGMARRAFVLGAGEKAAAQAVDVTGPILERLNKIAHDSPNLIRDKNAQEAIFLIREYDLAEIDNWGDVATAIQVEGRDVRQARHRFKRLSREDDKFKELLRAAEAGDQQAAFRLYEDYPETALPSWILDTHNLPKRPGVEIRRAIPSLAVERKVQDIVAPGTEGTVARDAAEREVAGLTAQAIPRYEQARVDFLEQIRSATGGEDLFKQMQSAAQDLGDLLDDAGKADMVAGFLNGMNELYIPRMISPEVRKQLTVMFLGSVGKQFDQDARKFAESFMKTRGPLDQLDTLTANDLIRELGTNFSGNRGLQSLFQKSDTEGVLATAAKLFEPIMPWLKKQDPDAVQFFNTNPFTAAYRRLEQSTRLHEKAFMNKELFAEGSPLVAERQTLRDAEARLATGGMVVNPETGKPMRLVHVNPEGNLLEQARYGGPVDVGSAVNHTIKGDNVARMMIGRRAIRDEMHGKLLAGEARFEDMEKQLDDALHLTDDNLTIADTDLGKVKAYKRFRQQRAQLSKVETVLVDETLPTSGLVAVDTEVTSGALRVAQKDFDTAERSWAFNEGLFGPHDPKTRAAGEHLAEARKRLEAAKRTTQAGDMPPAVTAETPKSATRTAFRGGVADPEDVLWYDRRLDEMEAEIKDELAELRDTRKAYFAGLKSDTKDKTSMLKDVLDRRLGPEETREMLRLRELEKGRGILPLDELRQTDPEGYQRLVSKFGDKEALWLDADVYDGMFGANGYLEKLRRPDLLADKFGIKWLDGMQNWFKAWTLMPPVFVQTWFRDLLSGHILQFMGGDVSPKAIAAAQIQGGRLAKAMRAGIRGDHEALQNLPFTRTLADGTTETRTGLEFYREMSRRGAVSSSWWRDEIAMGAEEAAQAAGAPKGKFLDLLKGVLPPVFGSKVSAWQHPFVRMGVQWRSFLDDQVRATGTLARWQSGQTLDDAIKQSMALSYDARKGLTSMERSVARRAMPFYGWTRFAVGKMLDLYVTKPGVVTFWQKLYDSAGKASLGDPQAFETVLPEFLRDNFGVPFKSGPDGPSYFVLGNYVPAGEIVRLATAIEDSFSPEKKGSVGNWIMERFDPFTKAAIETAGNYSFFSQRELETFPGEHTEMFGITMPKKTANLVRGIRFFNELDRLNLVSMNDFKGLTLSLGEAVPRGRAVGSAKQLPWWGRLLSGAFGPLPRGYLVDVKEEVRYKASEQERELNKLKGQLRKRLEDTGRPARQADVGTIQALIAEKLAQERTREKVEQQYAGSGLLRR